MKILVAPAHLIVDPNYGSEPAWAYNIIVRLAENYGVEIDALCGKAKVRNPSLSIRFLEVGLSKGDLFGRGLFFLRVYGVAKSLVADADLVHHMFPFGFDVGLSPLALFNKLNKPFMIGPIQYPVLGDITDYEFVTGRKGLEAKLLFALEQTSLRLIKKPIVFLHEATLREAEALIFDSRKTLELYKKQYSDILNGKILEAIPIGANTEQFTYVPPRRKSCFEILTVAYLRKRKGIQYLIQAMPIVLKIFKNVKLRILGDGPYKKNLVGLVEQLSLNKYVEFPGYVPRSELPKIYADSDIYVQPSLSEGLPSAMLEAMSTGRPVIATDVGVIGEHIKDGVNGFLVPPRNPEALAAKIIELLGNEELRLKMGLEARKYVEENLAWNKIVRLWYKTYKRLVGE